MRLGSIGINTLSFGKDAVKRLAMTLERLHGEMIRRRPCVFQSLCDGGHGTGPNAGIRCGGFGMSS